ncbi:ABC transporter substrate-binding protein [Herbihabitans rhizosphaerae]|uniref:ABC transporter substrate-binding protein n=1 Tax=Herbihabitans rhizosphaerae TaxID=1872711 RepID=UPI001F5F35E3|nr:ABC transporter substrate-binding protein [Herbihabitans rhizosphaerae]
MIGKPRGIRAGVPAALVLALAACTGAPTPTASGDTDGSTIVIAVAEEPASLNPLAGYAPHGAGKIYDALLEHRADLALRPQLAADMPRPSADGRSWTVALRKGVSFSNGSAFDANDVVATYNALLDPAYASPLRPRFAMLAGVRAVDASTVRFDLNTPYAPFPGLLVVGVLPSEALAERTPVASMPPPVGTGPFKVAEWQRGERLVLDANPSYVDGPPPIKKVTVEFVRDDQMRAQRLRDGKVDGVALPPSLARSYGDTTGFESVAQRSGEVRSIAMPSANPVTADPAIRLALNLAVDRKALVTGPLNGQGGEAHTPVPEVLAEFVEPSATFTRDLTSARRKLDDVGWRLGESGIRVRDGVTAAFTLAHATGDVLAAELATAFAADAATIGVRVTVRPVSATQFAARADADATVIATGDPFDLDPWLFPLLHGRSADSTVDTSLQVARAANDPAQRAAAYRKLQRAYVNTPSMVTLVAPRHSYVLRQNWTGYQPVVDASTQDLTWGPWWNLHRWQPR